MECIFDKSVDCEVKEFKTFLAEEEILDSESQNTKYSQMRDGGGVGKSSFRYNRDIISVKRKDSQILQSPEGIFLNTLELVVGHDQSGESAQVGEHKRRQHRDLVVAEVAEKFGGN